MTVYAYIHDTQSVMVNWNDYQDMLKELKWLQEFKEFAKAVAPEESKKAEDILVRNLEACFVTKAHEEGYTISYHPDSPFLTDEANAKSRWCVRRAAPPFVDKAGNSAWTGRDLTSAIGAARKAFSEEVLA